VEDEYELKEILGQGCFGSVYKAVHKASGKIRAIKQIELYEEDPEHYESL
jgi:serine/threonine protein kinase